MATLVLGAVGTAVGASFGMPQLGYALGSFAGNMVDNRLFSKNQRLAPNIGPRITDLKVQTSAYGEFIPQIFGLMRLGGNVIWSTDIKEVEIREEQSSGGGKGGGGKTTQTSVRYEYYTTLAIAICEGKIDEVSRIWADSKQLSINELTNSDKYEVYLGEEAQVASDIIKNNSTNPLSIPAYRGVAYVVIEDFPLSAYGNRIPNFTFEVKRTIRPTPAVEDLVKDIVLIPGSGEFVYSTTLSKKYSVTLDDNGNAVQNGTAVNLNMHNFEGKANVELSLDQLQATFPNLEWVAVVVNWFVTSKNLGVAEIIPKIEFASNRVTPNEWQVGAFSRTNAQEVKRFPDESLTYGGTPSDRSIIELCQAIKARGLKVLFYPMPLVDTVNEMAGEDDKPWRGRLVPVSAAQCNSFFTKIKGYNSFIRHYSQLNVGGTLLKNLVDAFVIGTEMVGITSFNAGGNVFTGVNNFIALASLVKADMPSVPLTYAADWTEYHSIGGYYHMDALWISANIDFVGIDNYMPLTPDLEQQSITEAKIKQYWQDGEGWAYYYSDAVNRTGKTDYIPNDGTSPYAWKNIELWWNTPHYHNNNPATPSGWNAKAKPIWLTEFGFASVDGSPNQPNVFVDPTSIESFYPRGSKRRIDFLAQRQAINATLEFWQTKNAVAGNSNLVPRTFLWTWDARPFPYFPDLLSVWADGKNWKTGHWVNGKMGVSNLGAIVSHLLEQVGFTSSDYDVTRLINPVQGYVINERQNVRAHLELLASIYFFDMVESDGVIKFVPRGQESIISINEDDLVAIESGNMTQTIRITRLQELELPKQVDVQYINRNSSYQSATQTAMRMAGSSIDKLSLVAPIVMDDSEARAVADVALYSSWYGRTSYEFILPPKYAAIEPTDVVTIIVRGVSHLIRITQSTITRAGQQNVSGVSEDIAAYDFYAPPSTISNNITANAGVVATNLTLLDLPPLPSDIDNNGTLRIGFSSDAAGWNGAVLYRSDDGGVAGGNNFNSMLGADTQSIIGTVLNVVNVGVAQYFDRSNFIDVALVRGELSSKSELAILNGANACVVGEEIIQFTTATLTASNRYRLEGLLRGRLGTEHLMSSHAIGERFVLLDSGVIKEALPLTLLGITSYYKAVSIGATLMDSLELSFKYQGRKFLPFSPVHIKGVRDGANNLTISWIRRTRLGGQWNDYADVPLMEERELYQVDIFNGANVVRTITATTPACAYSAAQQIVDFGSTQAIINVRIYQISAIIGRGTAGIAAI